MTHIRGNMFLMKEINRATILSLLHREKAMSRAEIAKVTKLSATTISSLVDELIAEGFIVESGEKSSPGAGRKAISLEISKDKGFVIAVGLGNQNFYCTLSNFHSEVVADLSIPTVKGNNHVLQAIIECINGVIERADISDFSKIRGVGIASPGIINEIGDTITYSRYLELSDFNVVKLLQNRYNLPMFVMNDTSAAAFQQYYKETNSDVKNVLYVWIHEGVGARIILNGQVLSGYKGRAGEVILLHDELFNTTNVLVKARQKAIKLGASRIPEDIEDVLEAYNNDEAWLEPTMNRILMFLSRAVAIMMNLIGPEQLILDGWFIKSDKCMGKIHQYLSQFTAQELYEPELVVRASSGKKNHVKGATTMTLYQLFKGKVSVV